MEPHRILVISDTHGLLRPEVLRRAADCEAVLHAGDIDRPEILERLKAVAPVYAVRGNVDGKWAQSLPEELELELLHYGSMRPRQEGAALDINCPFWDRIAAMNPVGGV